MTKRKPIPERKPGRKHNNAKKTTVTFQRKEYTFPSKAEANHFLKLCTRAQNGEIDRLKLQPEFKLIDSYTIATDKTQSGKSTITGLKYTPDFEYYENGKKIVVEVKGRKTTDYQMRYKLFLALAYTKYGVDTFIEVTDGKATTYECKSINIKRGK